MTINREELLELSKALEKSMCFPIDMKIQLHRSVREKFELMMKELKEAEEYFRSVNYIRDKIAMTAVERLREKGKPITIADIALEISEMGVSINDGWFITLDLDRLLKKYD